LVDIGLCYGEGEVPSHKHKESKYNFTYTSHKTFCQILVIIIFIEECEFEK